MWQSLVLTRPSGPACPFNAHVVLDTPSSDSASLSPGTGGQGQEGSGPLGGPQKALLGFQGRETSRGGDLESASGQHQGM